VNAPASAQCICSWLDTTERRGECREESAVQSSLQQTTEYSPTRTFGFSSQHKRTNTQKQLEVDGKPLGKCLRPVTHVCTHTPTDKRTTRKHNASSPTYRRAHTHTHPFNGPFPGLPRWASTRKVKPIWILLKQETVSGSDIRWAICKSAPRSRQITTPTPRHSVFLQAGCPSCHPTNSVKAHRRAEV